jgi:hypothetical protein
VPSVFNREIELAEVPHRERLAKGSRDKERAT